MPTLSNPCRKSRPAGLTIVEIIVVIGIITLLMAVAVPSLRSVKMNARMMAEQSAARQLMAAYTAYANVNQDRVLTGYGPKSITAFDAKGDPIGGNSMSNLAKQRYPWRLAPFLDYNLDTFFLHDQNELLDQVQHSTYDTYLYTASLVPSLGLNARWVGGNFSTSANPQACLESEINCSPQANLCCLFNQWFGRFWITRISEARTPERLIVFASARSESEPIAGWGTRRVEGHHIVQSPFWTKVASEWNNTFSKHESPAKYGFVSPRYAGHAVIGFMDGHTGLLSTNELRDMRYWADRATAPDWHMAKGQ